MRDAEIHVRHLSPNEDDAERFRDIRLEGLRVNPQAFGSTLSGEAALPLSWFRERLATSSVFGACRDELIVGVAGFARQQGQKVAHKGILWGMYVRPEARNVGAGHLLGQSICQHARQTVELIQLSVIKENEQAQRLYRRLGFVQYGIERHGLKYEGRYYDEVLMAKMLE